MVGAESASLIESSASAIEHAIVDVMYSKGMARPWLIRRYDERQKGFFSVRGQTFAEVLERTLKGESDGQAP